MGPRAITEVFDGAGSTVVWVLGLVGVVGEGGLGWVCGWVGSVLGWVLVSLASLRT